MSAVDRLRRRWTPSRRRTRTARRAGHAAVVRPRPGRHDHRRVQQRAKQTIGQIALGDVHQPGRPGEGRRLAVRTSVNSGDAQVGTAGTGGRGSLAGGALEMSNVDLSSEFTNLIIAQRGFQANSPRHHHVRRDAAGAGQPQALTGRDGHGRNIDGRDRGHHGAHGGDPGAGGARRRPRPRPGIRASAAAGQLRRRARRRGRADDATTSATTLDADGVPVELAGYGNGQIPDSALQTVDGTTAVGAGGQQAEQLRAAAAKDGVQIGITDSYRSYAAQVDVAQRKGLYSQGGLAAKPGTSEHGWGMAVDLKLDAAGLSWMRAHGGEYGYVADTPRESWHWAFKP